MNLKHNRRNARGLTLIEVVVSIALLAIVAVLLVSVMAQALNFMMVTRKNTTGGMSAAASIEASQAATTPNGTSSFTITINGSTYTDSGTYTSGTDSGVTYYEFVPNQS